MTDHRIRLGGFATGNYNSQCCHCGKVFVGDKRAVSCLLCAARLADAEIAALRRQRDELHATTNRYLERARAAEARAYPHPRSFTARAGPVMASVCGCWTCSKDRAKEMGQGEALLYMARMFLCETCGNKRCPHATDHRLICTHSNDPGQEGSRYE